MTHAVRYLFPEPIAPEGVRIVFVTEPVAQGDGFLVLQVTSADGREQGSVILDCQQQLFTLADQTPTGNDVVFHDGDAEAACAQLPRSCPQHRLEV